MEPVTAALSAGNAAKALLGGLVDRWARAKHAQLDTAALTRLLLLEARRNLAILDATIGREDGIDPAGLWEVPPVLQVEVIETVLGQGPVATKAFSELKQLVLSEPEGEHKSADFLTSLYVRITALQSLALLSRRSTLKKVRIERRLGNLRADLLHLVQALARHAR